MTFIISIGAATTRYTTVIREINVLFNGQVMVVSKDSIVIQAIPIGGSMLMQNYTESSIRRIPSAEETVPILFVIPLGVSGPSRLVPVNFTIGIPVDDWHSILGSSSLKGNGGHYPTNESSKEVVVGGSLADQYNWNVGTELVIKGDRLNVTGILDTKVALLGRSIIMPLELAQTIYSYDGMVNIIAVKPAVGYSEKDLALALRENLTYADALTEEERNDIVEPVIAQVEAWNRGIETVIFLMSLILVMNVMVMSVSERRRDFATLEAIGAPLNYVFRAVILEASLIGALGGALGIFFGSLSAIILASLYTSIPLAQFFTGVFDLVPPLYMLEMFTGIVAFCCIGGIIPALNAARIRVAEALRAEY
jgi:putative ABC transport system permease protein